MDNPSQYLASEHWAPSLASLNVKTCGLCLSFFQVESSNLPFTAEGQLRSGHFFVNDGILKVPDEVRWILPALCHQFSASIVLVCMVTVTMSTVTIVSACKIRSNGLVFSMQQPSLALAPVVPTHATTLRDEAHMISQSDCMCAWRCSYEFSKWLQLGSVCDLCLCPCVQDYQFVLQQHLIRHSDFAVYLLWYLRCMNNFESSIALFTNSTGGLDLALSCGALSNMQPKKKSKENENAVPTGVIQREACVPKLPDWLTNLTNQWLVSERFARKCQDH